MCTHSDEVYIAKPWMKARRHYDIGRVEVLKGPQGTLFGRNTTGGSLNFYTNAPADRFEAELEAGIDEHERYRVTGMINSPLSDQLSGRFSFNTELGSGGPQKNLFSGDEHGKPDLLDFRWVDDRFLEATAQAFDKSEDYWVANMRVALASQDEKWEVAVYGTNLFDTEYLTYINNIGFFKLDIFGERQTFGASVRYRFQ